MRRFLLALMLVLPAAAQRDFLSPNESDQIREAQDPNDRLKLYAYFARQRMDMVKLSLSKDKPGRSLLVHDALEDLGSILDAIDTVADDALKHRKDIKLGLAAVAAAENEILPALEKIQESRPKDISRYDFALKQAIETAKDSLEQSAGDVDARAAAVKAKDDKEKKDLEAMMAPGEREAKQAAEKKAAQTEQKRKPPTLLRKGETEKKQ